MTNECCVICKNENKVAPDTKLSKEVIYRRSLMVEFLLCYNHSTELFKIGQEQFILKYPHLIKDRRWDEKKEKKRFISFA